MIKYKLIVMVSYYYLKKNETNILEFLFVIVLAILIMLLIAGNISYATLLNYFVPILIISMFLPKIHKVHQKIMTDGLVIITFLILAVFWILQVEIPYLKILISNEQMVVYSSFLYAYLTYKNLKSNSDIFKYQRIPYILVEGKNSDNGDIFFVVTNSSDYAAKDFLIYFEFVPRSHSNTSLKAIKLFISRKKEALFCYFSFLTFQRKNPTYETLLKLNRLEPNSSTKIVLNDFVTNQLKIEESMVNHTKFDIIANWRFISIDNLLSDEVVYKRFQYDKSSGEIQLIKTSNEPFAIY